MSPFHRWAAIAGSPLKGQAAVWDRISWPVPRVWSPGTQRVQCGPSHKPAPSDGRVSSTAMSKASDPQKSAHTSLAAAILELGQICLPSIKFILYWGIVDLQCRVPFWHTAECFSYTYKSIFLAVSTPDFLSCPFLPDVTWFYESFISSLSH